ncbi:hypothetical protein F5Y16DRAFT_396512 [Xylariaceae sp. FL0255]|nr:hypothetical protein F5Y16DRAFT_396512 [Xylariaceae sp. FL0255]
MVVTTQPAIVIEAVADMVLQVKAGKVNPRDGKVGEFPWLNPPSPEQSLLALFELTSTSPALITPPTSNPSVASWLITPFGQLAAVFPGSSRWFGTIKASDDLGVGLEIVAIAACLETTEGIKPNDNGQWELAADEDKSGEEELKMWCRHHFLNHHGLEKAYELYESLKASVEHLAKVRLTSGRNIRDPNAYEQTIIKALCRGQFLNIAMRDKSEDTYRTVNFDVVALLERHSCLIGLDAKWIVYDKVFRSVGMPFFYTCSMVEPEMFIDLDYFKEENLFKKAKQDAPEQTLIAKALAQARRK